MRFRDAGVDSGGQRFDFVVGEPTRFVGLHCHGCTVSCGPGLELLYLTCVSRVSVHGCKCKVRVKSANYQGNPQLNRYRETNMVQINKKASERKTMCA